MRDSRTDPAPSQRLTRKIGVQANDISLARDGG